MTPSLRLWSGSSRCVKAGHPRFAPQRRARFDAGARLEGETLLKDIAENPGPISRMASQVVLNKLSTASPSQSLRTGRIPEDPQFELRAEVGAGAAQRGKAQRRESALIERV